jgi:hypothetical protein
MQSQKILPLIKGAIKYVPGVNQFKNLKTGGTIESRYCYTVWMRHLINWCTIKPNLPKTLAELGPGDSLGIGLAALLSGCECIYALDIVKYWDSERNLMIFNELIELFKLRANIPDNKEYPEVFPEINNYAFPSDKILRLQFDNALSKERLELIRNEIINIDNPNNKFIKCKIPWYEPNAIEKDAVDFIYSQAVLEYVENLEITYEAMKNWLKPGGLMSHTIDFKSYDTPKAWNGYWTFNDLEWKIVTRGKPFSINRRPFSYHIDLHTKYGFKVLKTNAMKMENGISGKQIANRFKDLTDEDLTTSALYILSEKL